MAEYQNLKQIIKGEVANDEATLERYSRDASLFAIRPQLVVFPKDTDDLKNLVRFTAERKPLDKNLSLTARSGGSDMTGAVLTNSLVLDFSKHFNRIIEITSDAATVQPGVFYREFEKETLKRNLLLPCFPASRELCTLGGMVANNSSGEKTLKYGSVRQFVQELKVILADGSQCTLVPLSIDELQGKFVLKNFEGEVYRKLFKLIEANFEVIKAARPRVSKNSSGYALWEVWDKQTFDLTKLFTGSQGTLGLITEIKFKLVGPEPASQMLVVFLRDLKNLGNIVNEVLKFEPESFESYDHHTLKLALRFIPDFIRRMRGNAFTLGLKFLPEFFSVLRGGLPKLVLTAEFTGQNIVEVRQRALLAKKSLSQYGVNARLTRDSAEAEKYHLIRRESFNLLRHKIKDKQTAPFIDDIIVKPEYLPEFLPRLESMLDESGVVYTIAGHIGDGNFHIIPLMNLDDPNAKQIITGLSKKVFDLVFEYKGSMSAEHNDGLVRTSFLTQMFGQQVYDLFVETKSIFDPQGIFNPGKKVNPDYNFAFDHLKHGQ